MSDTSKPDPTDPQPEEPKLNGKAVETTPKTEIILSDNDKRLLLQLNEQTMEQRQVFNDASLEVYRLNQAHLAAQATCSQAYQNFMTTNQKIQQRLAEIATLEGVDPRKEKWNFDFQSMTFKRIG